mmetsp:Transcript_34220/g.74815  ORF Transcript_34220/g.74815 Transcript_34220/m.74815 type:complete len:796 (-) Transcript_34220:121-2508(-)|eukprot:CAMPEP_0118932064 /NCGR_PEP_ID=MMETSP1169-20130426/8990_1 /TAXON_ID=36882 /ORGANISM="Pyramimonas obovata, Strain CCMP722" /LENGTH=795 /DNA_ID=CAMNT_0006874659 /DNA_START=81 /DNA_END=2468 /DNA_ORIENTATION=+
MALFGSDSDSDSETIASVLVTEPLADAFLVLAVVASLLFAAYQAYLVSQVKVRNRKPEDANSGTTEEYLLAEDREAAIEIIKKTADIQDAITEGANSFLFTEYQWISAFMIPFGVVVFLLLAAPGGFSKVWTKYEYSDSSYPDNIWDGGVKAPKLNAGIFAAIAFFAGAITSLLSGYLGMAIATYANARTALEAQKGIAPAFVVAFRSGAVMGFLLTSLGLLVLFVIISVFRVYFDGDWRSMFEVIAGYGLGGSSIALFGRVGGGIYTKAADVGADLVGKVEQNIPEDDPRNPAVIADNVGDNVGDIAGMGADLFGSFAESTCAALVLSSVTSFGKEQMIVPMLYPLLLSGGMLVSCMITTIIATNIKPARKVSEIEPCLKAQLIVSCVIMAIVSFVITMTCLPADCVGLKVVNGEPTSVPNWAVWICVACGLFTGLAIGLVTEYYTSNAYRPVQEVAQSCRTGAATNIIFGLALGYQSNIIPMFGLGLTIFLSHQLASFYGIAVAALGMLGTLATALAIDAYGPISDNAGGIAEMAGMGDDVRERTDALDAAGNTTAAIGKGFAIGSACLVSLALFGSFVTASSLTQADTTLLNNRVYVGLIVGAMLPYWFSALTMKSVGTAALAMVEEVRRQFRENAGILEGTVKPDYKRCVQISTSASLNEMIAPGALVLLAPVITGTLFGTKTLAGLLAGSLVSGVQIAISASNTGGAWDNAKKYIEAGRTTEAQALGGKGSDAHTAAVIGDTVGDPLKDTSGPSLNILIKLMAVESLVFASFFKEKTPDGLLFKMFSDEN